MTKKKKISPTRKYHTATVNIKETVLSEPSKSMPSNLEEEKEKFFKSGSEPKFNIRDVTKLNELASKAKNQIRFDLLGEAEYILEKVRDQYGNGEFYMEQAFGIRITREEATPMVLKYIAENSLAESINIHWCDNIACSAKMVWTGPMVQCNKPELRRYSLWINSSDENSYMRESGIKCLMDHEIGTHFFRMVNDGFQPWFSDRYRFGLRSLGSFEGQCTEEGLATLNTVLRGRLKLLWTSAFSYYTACKAAEMTFKQLFDHLGRYTSNLDHRWKQVMRVKRGLADPSDLGGFGNDQCYFEGAVKILRNMDNIDFYLLMTGKICYDELDRIKRCARRDVVRFPVFLKNMAAYIRSLKKLAEINGLNVWHPARSPPSAYLRRLHERKSESWGKKKKVRVKKHRFSLSVRSDGKKKEFIEPEITEVKSFPLQNPIVNTHLIRLTKKKQEEKEERVNGLISSVSEQLKTVDNKLDQQIEQMQSIVEQHAWTKTEESYKSDLFKEVEGDMTNNYLVFSDICCLDVEGLNSGENTEEEEDTAHSQEVGERSKSSCLYRGGDYSMEDSPEPEVRCQTSLGSTFVIEDKEVATPKAMLSKKPGKDVSRKSSDDLNNLKDSKANSKKREVSKSSVARLTSREQLDLNTQPQNSKLQTLTTGRNSPKTLQTLKKPWPKERNLSRKPELLPIGAYSPIPNRKMILPKMGKAPSLPPQHQTSHDRNMYDSDVSGELDYERRASFSSTYSNQQGYSRSDLGTPVNNLKKHSALGTEKSKFPIDIPYRLSMRERVSSPSIVSIKSNATTTSIKSFMTTSMFEPLVLKPDSALKKNESQSMDPFPVVLTSK